MTTEDIPVVRLLFQFDIYTLSIYPNFLNLTILQMLTYLSLLLCNAVVQNI